ncbi:hypothetical protein DFP83_1303 [Idiomarina fontislapidosi]|nr:hypothetical protein DFP83_1303 [Idiomarina fontislapidosi]
MKDVEMALEAGVTAVFARYGTTHFADGDDRYELLKAVTHWTDEDVAREKLIKDNSKHLKPDYVIDRFDELLDIINFRKKNE